MPLGKQGTERRGCHHRPGWFGRPRFALLPLLLEAFIFPLLERTRPLSSRVLPRYVSSSSAFAKLCMRALGFASAGCCVRRCRIHAGFPCSHALPFPPPRRLSDRILDRQELVRTGNYRIRTSSKSMSWYHDSMRRERRPGAGGGVLLGATLACLLCLLALPLASSLSLRPPSSASSMTDDIYSFAGTPKVRNNRQCQPQCG